MPSASSRVSTPITWGGGSNTCTVSTAVVVSDAMFFHDDDWEVRLQLSLDNVTTPSSADVVAIYVGYVTGDITGGAAYSASDFITTGQVSMYPSDDPGEDPVRMSWPIDCSAPAFQVLFYAPNAATHNFVARGMFCSHRNK